MATMYVGGGLYLPTTGTASKPKTTSTPTGGTVTVAQRNAIASKTKPAATTVAKKPTTNTLSSMAGSSLGTTSRPASSPTASLVSGSSSPSSSSRNTVAQNAAVASLLSGGGTGGINAVRRSANPVNVVGYRPPPVGSSTHGMIVNSPGNYPPTSFQSLQNAASSLAAIQAAQRERDARAAKTSVPASYDYLFGARNDDKPYVSAYDVARYGSMNSGPGLLPSKEFGGYPGARPEAKLASTLLAGGAGALDAVVSPAYGLGTGLLDYLSGGTPDDFMNSYAGGYGDANAIFQQFETLDPLVYNKGANAGLVAATAYGMPGVMGPTRAAAEAAAAAALARRAPRAVAGIDAALTPRQAQFRELMDNLNANPAVAGAAKPVNAPTEGLTLVHGSNNPALTLDDIQIIRSGGQKQGKPNRVYGGLYTHAEDDVNLAANYAKMGDGTPSLYNVQIKPGAKVEDFGTADVTRLKKERIDELVEQGVGVVKGQNPLGKTEWVVIDKNAIQDFAPRAAAGIDAAVAPRPVSPGPRIPQGGISPTPAAVSPAEIARLENILGNLGYSAPRTAAAGTRLPGAANMLDEGFVSRAAAANDDRLLANMMRENDARALTSAIDENDALVLRNAMRENDTLNALNARADGSDQFFFDVNPAMRYMDTSEAANIIRRPGGQTIYPPGYMSADEAANVLRPGPRVATDAGMDPITKRLLIAAGGAGVALPGLAGLSLLANGQLGPAPTATTPPAPEPGGIDVAASGAPRSARALRQAQINQSAANLDPAIASQDQFNKWLVDNALANAPVETIAVDAEGAPVGVVGEDVGADVPKVMPEDESLTAQELKDAEAAFLDPENQAQLDAATDKPESEFGSYTRFPSGSAGDEAATATPAAGTKFTPGPGQFVGTNGYIYEQSSDGSFENVGRVPGYTPAQLSEAANKGAFRDPNNIVTGGAKPRKQARKKGERTFFDDAGDFLKDRFDDSVYGKLSKLFFPDDAAAAEAAATGPEAVEYYSTPPSSVPESLVSSSGSSKKRKKKDEDETDGGTGGTGTGGTGTSPYTPEVQAMLNALYGNYMRQYNGPGVGYVPGVDPERNYFTSAFADGGLVDGRLVLGDGGPKEDKIPATIDGVEQAKLSNGEFVMTAAAVKNAGGGDIELGAKRLMDLNNMLSYGRPAGRLKVQHVK